MAVPRPPPAPVMAQPSLSVSLTCSLHGRPQTMSTSGADIVFKRCRGGGQLTYRGGRPANGHRQSHRLSFPLPADAVPRVAPARSSPTSLQPSKGVSMANKPTPPSPARTKCAPLSQAHRPDRKGAVRRRMGATWSVQARPWPITCAALVAPNRTEQLKGHLERANNGVTPDEIGELITHLAFYGGWLVAMSGALVAKDVSSTTRNNRYHGPSTGSGTHTLRPTTRAESSIRRGGSVNSALLLWLGGFTFPGSPSASIRNDLAARQAFTAAYSGLVLGALQCCRHDGPRSRKSGVAPHWA